MGEHQILQVTESAIESRLDAVTKKLASRQSLLPDPNMITAEVVTDNGVMAGQTLIDRAVTLLSNLEEAQEQLQALATVVRALQPCNIKSDKDRKAILQNRPQKRWSSSTELRDTVQVALSLGVKLGRKTVMKEIVNRTVDESLKSADNDRIAFALAVKGSNESSFMLQQLSLDEAEAIEIQVTIYHLSNRFDADDKRTSATPISRCAF